MLPPKNSIHFKGYRRTPEAAIRARIYFFHLLIPYTIFLLVSNVNVIFEPFGH